MKELRASLQDLARYLEAKDIAHGDIQPGNVMVSNSGRTLQLIDYDGMYVKALQPLGQAEEVGAVNFQHPGRGRSTWNPRLDRFSFILLDLALRAIELSPDMWNSTQSDSEAVVFRANDFADTKRSEIFKRIKSIPHLACDVDIFSSICCGSIDIIPSLDDFCAKRISFHAARHSSQPAAEPRPKYISSYPVLDAASFDLCRRHCGDRIELIGQIKEVYLGQREDGKRYCFLNFGRWKDNITKISIWPNELSTMRQSPDNRWKGEWVSVVGLLESYINENHGYYHLEICIDPTTQLHIIDDHVARFRLDNAEVSCEPPQSSPIGTSLSPQHSSPHNRSVNLSENQMLLEEMRNNMSGKIKKSNPDDDALLGLMEIPF